MTSPPPEAESETKSDFNQIDQALVLFWLELYRSIHRHNSVAAQTATRLFQLLVGAIAALGGFAMTFVAQDTVAHMALSGILLLMVMPLTITVLYTIWLRETARVARNSLFLLRLEGKISKYVTELQTVFIATSTTGRSRAYSHMRDIFPDRFIDWEVWLRRENHPTGRFDLSDKLTLMVISIVLWAVGVLFATVGLGLWRIFAFLQCAISPEKPLKVLSEVASRSGLWDLLKPIGDGPAPAICVLGSDLQVIGQFSYLAFILALLAVTISVVRTHTRYKKIEQRIVGRYFPQGNTSLKRLGRLHIRFFNLRIRIVMQRIRTLVT